MMVRDDHPLRYSKLAKDIEKVLFRRAVQKKLDGYTLETALEIADAITGSNRSDRGPVPDIIERLMDFDKEGITASDRYHLRCDAAMEIHALRRALEPFAAASTPHEQTEKGEN